MLGARGSVARLVAWPDGEARREGATELGRRRRRRRAGFIGPLTAHSPAFAGCAEPLWRPAVALPACSLLALVSPAGAFGAVAASALAELAVGGFDREGLRRSRGEV